MRVSNNKTIVLITLAATAFIAVYAFLTSAYVVYGSINEQQHYINISWHLWQNHNWLVLHGDSGVYLNKPPLQFWLTKLLWLVFGVSDWTLRVIPWLFAVGILYVVAKSFALLWPEHKRQQWLPCLLLLGCYYFFHYIIYYMQDIPLMFFIALAFWALLYAREKNALLGWLIFAVANGLGLLTKGPVVFVFTLPSAIILPYFLNQHRGGGRRLSVWYLLFVLSLMVSVGICLSWLLPMIHQLDLNLTTYITKDVLQHNVEHGHGAQSQQFLGKYVIVAPFLLLPWSVHPYVWRCLLLTFKKIKGIVWDKKVLWLVISIAIVLLILTAIPAKATRYLMPLEIPFVLLIAKMMLSVEKKYPTDFRKIIYRSMNLVLGVISLLAAIGLFIFHASIEAKIQHALAWQYSIIILLIVAICYLILFSIKTRRFFKYMLTQLAGVFLLLVLFVALVIKTTLAQSHLIEFDQCLRQAVQQNHPIAYKYIPKGYYYRIATGKRIPPGPILHTTVELKKWALEHPNGMIVSQINLHQSYDQSAVFCQLR